MKKTKCMLAEEWSKGMPPPRSDPTCLPPVGWMAMRSLMVTGVSGAEKKENFTQGQERCLIPELYKKAFPKEDLDGEYWCGRDQQDFQYMGVVRKKVPIDDDWAGHIKYVVYDLPNHPGSLKKDSKHFKK